MKAMILAAGFGKRLGELTKSKPKPLLEVKGKPLIDYHIEKLISSGFKTIAINTHYLGAQISDHIIDNFGQRVEIHISHEKQLLGTGGGIKKAISDFGDGRYWPGGKFLNKKEIIGKAYFRFWPLSQVGFFSK